MFSPSRRSVLLLLLRFPRCRAFFLSVSQLDSETRVLEEGTISSISPTSSCCRETSTYEGGDQETGMLTVERRTLSSMVERLPWSEVASAAVRRWMEEGNAVERGDVFHAINRLRRLKLYSRALEERPYKLRDLDYAYFLEFTIKIHGVSRGESLFLRIPQQYHNELLYNNLVMSCLEDGLIRRSLDYMRKMRELGFRISPYVYNRLIILHSSSGRKKDIPKVLTQMKADGVPPHPSTYNILLKIEADEHSIEGLSKTFDQMKNSNVEPNEITYGILALAHAVARLYTVCETYVDAIERLKTGNNWATLDILLMLYGYLGKGKDLDRTWKSVQELPHVPSKSYLLAVEALGRMGSIKRAEEIWAEMKLQVQAAQAKHFNSILSVFCRHGLVDKACTIFKEMVGNGCKPNAITYRHLTLGCLKAGMVKEALKTMDMAKDETVSFQVRRSIPWLETTHMLAEEFAEIGDLESTKKLFEEFKETKYWRYTFVSNTLVKAHVKAKVYDPFLLRRMILGGAIPDAETYSLLRLIEQFKT